MGIWIEIESQENLDRWVEIEKSGQDWISRKPRPLGRDWFSENLDR
jgi:hypothetical protein